MKVLVVGEGPQQIRDVLGAAELLAESSGSSITAASLGGSEEELAAALGGAAPEAYLIGGPSHAPEALAAALEALAGEGLYAALAPAVKNCTDALARFSAKAGLPMVTEATEFSPGGGSITVRRAALAGRAVAEYRIRPPFAATVQPKRFPPPEAPGRAAVKRLEVSADNRVRVVGSEAKRREGVDIAASDIVVGVGRGFRSKEDLSMAFRLAELLGGAVGCSRPIAADYGWLPEDRWIGISAKKIRPKLYLAIGISGAPQHMSGVLDSRIIAAINKDKNAPIFQYADYGVVGDLYQLVPALIRKLEARGGRT